jgi:hypothetical protein
LRKRDDDAAAENRKRWLKLLKKKSLSESDVLELADLLEKDIQVRDPKYAVVFLNVLREHATASATAATRAEAEKNRDDFRMQIFNLDAAHAAYLKKFQEDRAILAGKQNAAHLQVALANEAAALTVEIERRFAPLFGGESFIDSFINAPARIRDCAMSAGIDSVTLGYDPEQHEREKIELIRKARAQQFEHERAEQRKQVETLQNQQADFLKPDEPSGASHKVEHLVV